MNDPFNVEEQYQKYLTRVGLKEEKMNPIQAKETKQAFFGAWGQLLLVMRDDITTLEEDEAIEKLKDMNTQVLIYFTNAHMN